MSRGLGALQKKIIATGGATKTIWQCGIPIRVQVADDHAKEACGVCVVEKPGTVWRKDKKPWYEAEVAVDTADRFHQFKASFRDVTFKEPTRAEWLALLDACISLHHFRRLEWPHLWAKHIKNVPRPDSLGRMMPQVPADIARGRNVANASLSRAVTSMEKRGIVAWGQSLSSRDVSEVVERWPLGGGGDVAGNRYAWHNVLFVLDAKATVNPATE